MQDHLTLFCFLLAFCFSFITSFSISTYSAVFWSNDPSIYPFLAFLCVIGLTRASRDICCSYFWFISIYFLISLPVCSDPYWHIMFMCHCTYSYLLIWWNQKYLIIDYPGQNAKLITQSIEEGAMKTRNGLGWREREQKTKSQKKKNTKATILKLKPRMTSKHMNSKVPTVFE